jgi:hypothetical protein
MKRAIKQDKDCIIDILVKSFKGNKSVDFVVGKSEKRRRVLMEYSYENCLRTERFSFQKVETLVFSQNFLNQRQIH